MRDKMNGPERNDNDLIGFIATTVETMRDQMATKSDLAGLATKGDLAGLATKGDLDRLESRFETKLEVEVTTIRGDIEQVHLRLDSIERALSTRLGQIETEVSRLRSAVYLLARDKPEILRLLSPPPSGKEVSF
jgi:hypothetical protein